MKKLITTICAAVAAIASSVFSAAPAEMPVCSAETIQNHTPGASEITLVNSQTDLSVKLSDDTDEDYFPSSRKWNGISTAVSCGNNLFVSWYTGGTKEPHADNYIPVAASDDGGESWKDPFIIIDPVTSASVVLPVFFVNGKGELLLYYSVLPGSKMYAIKLIGADGPLDKIAYEGPFQVSDRTVFVKPTILSDGSIIYVTGDEDGYSGVYKSTDDGYSYKKISTIKSAYVKPDKTYTEASVVEKKDGSLWMLSRLEKGYDGGIEQAFSTDGGMTWTESKGGLAYPLRGPGARSAFIKLKSGALAFVTNDSGAREMMTVFLSEDDGETWPYSLLLDRYISAYPEIYQAPDGRILVSYDKGRYTENSIRLSIFTEEDVKAGYFVSDVSRDKLTVTKLNREYADIVSVNDAYKSVYAYPVGTASSVIRDQLPTTFTVTDSNGAQHELTGTWKSAGYNKEAAGTYFVTFSCESPETLLDSYQLLRVRVELSEKDDGGCGSTAKSGTALLAVLIGAFLLRKKKNKNISDRTIEIKNSDRRKIMKLKKFFVTAFALLTMSAVASSAGIIFADGEEGAGGLGGGESSKAQTEFLFGADGTFEGVKDNTPTDDGVYLGVKSGMEGRAELLRLTIDFDEAVDPSQSTGIFLKMLTPDFNNGSFKILAEDSEGNHWRMSHGGTVSDPFVLEDGTVSSISMSKNNFAWVANQTGTLYIPWSQTFASVGASGNFLDEEKTRRVESISFYFTLAAHSGGSMYYGGLGMTVYSVGTAFVGTDAETSSAQMLLTAASASSTADETKTDAAINYAAVDKGQTYRIDGALNSGMTVITKAGDEGYSDIISYGEISRSDAKLTVNYVDEEGISLKNSETLRVKFDKAAGEYPYNIEAPVIPDFDYVSSDLPLTGNLPSVNTTVTLTYKPAEIPDTDWDENTSNEIYEAAFDENGVLSSLNVKSDMNKAVYMGIKKSMTAQSGLYSQLSIAFGDGIDTSKSTGIFVKFLGARANYGFKFMITDAEGTVYTAYADCVGADMFTSEEGECVSLTEKNTQHVFTAEAGTWYIPWEYFRVLGSENEKMASGTVIKSASFAMNLTKTSWYGGYGVKIASAGTVKAGVNKTKVEVLLNAADLTYTSDASDATADVNVADVTKGAKVFCNSAFNETEVLLSGEERDLAVANAELAPPSVNVTLRFVDEKGKSIRDPEVLSVSAGAYELTAPTIMGYVYKSADKGLSGEIYESTEIVLTYSLADIKITLKFVDTEGNEIAEAEETSCKYKDIYTVEAKKIDGYEFVEASRKLSGTAMADMTITLTYQKKSGCGSVIAAGPALLCFGTAVAAAFACLKKKK